MLVTAAIGMSRISGRAQDVADDEDLALVPAIHERAGERARGTGSAGRRDRKTSAVASGDPVR